jgi:exodeoxyribonuclease V gamma subunit
VDARLPDGTRVVGSVALRLGVETGDPTGPAELYYSRFKPTHRVAAWLDLMALAATDPSRPWRALAVSRPDRTGADPTVNDLVPARAEDEPPPSVSEALAVAVDCYRRGMTEPLPLFPKFSYNLYRGKSARGSWKGFQFPEDGDRLAVRVAFGDRDFDGITGLTPRRTDPGVGKGRAMRFATHLYRTIDQSTSARPGGDVGRTSTGASGR